MGIGKKPLLFPPVSVSGPTANSACEPLDVIDTEVTQ